MKFLQQEFRMTSMGIVGCIVLLALLIAAIPSGSEAVVPPISFYRLAGGLVAPVHITHAGDSSGRIFVVEQQGRIRIIKNGELQAAPFLDISARVLFSGEQGLLSVAFPPLFASKNHFYVYYADLSGNIRVSRFSVTANPDVADPASEVSILTIAHPTFTNHYGGQLAFGPDSFLYLGTGDGGSGGDPGNNAQNTAVLLGKLIRIDVESGAVPYAIPPGNPFAGSLVSRQEIWSYGLRNPFRFSFDRLTGDLYIGDVGQNLFEEVDIQPSGIGGNNYGWKIMEGTSCFNPANFSSPLPSCNTAGLTLPVLSYSHGLGDCAVIGGFVYRGQVVRAMQGLYVYGDECTGRIWGLRSAGLGFENALLFDTPFVLSSFGEDQAGQLYVTSYVTGEIFRVGTPGMVTGDFNGDLRPDFAFLNATGEIFYSTAPGVFINLPGSLIQMVSGNFSGIGRSGIAGLGVDGSVWLSTDMVTLVPVAMLLSTLVSGDFNADGKTDLAGLAPDGTIWISTNLSVFQQIPGTPVHLVSGDFNGDGKTDLAGLNSDGSIMYTTNLTDWVTIPGTLSYLVSGHFNPLRAGDQLAGLALDGTVWVSTDLATFQQVPGMTLKHLLSADFNADGQSDLAGLDSSGGLYYSTNLSAWNNIPVTGFVSQVTGANINGAAPDDLVGMTVDGSLWQSTDLINWVSAGPLRGACHNPAVRLAGTLSYYAGIQLAYDAASAGQTVLMQGLDFTETPDLNRAIPVRLAGGYACDYTANPGFTTIHGMLTISNGSAAIDNLIIL